MRVAPATWQAVPWHTKHLWRPVGTVVNCA